MARFSNHFVRAVSATSPVSMQNHEWFTNTTRVGHAFATSVLPFHMWSSLMRRCLPITTIVTVIFCSVLAAWAEETEASHPFTVKDSIELSSIINPTYETMIEERGAYPLGGPIVSPNGKYFFLITQRGVFSTDALEATMWVFDRKTVSDYISRQSATKPIPKRIATLSASSNTPVMYDVR